VATTLGVIGIVLALFFGVLGHLSETHRTFLGRTYEFDVYGVPRRAEPRPTPRSNEHAEPGHSRAQPEDEGQADLPDES
jgi:hypothetical protein